MRKQNLHKKQAAHGAEKQNPEFTDALDTACDYLIFIFSFHARLLSFMLKIVQASKNCCVSRTQPTTQWHSIYLSPPRK